MLAGPVLYHIRYSLFVRMEMRRARRTGCGISERRQDQPVEQSRIEHFLERLAFNKPAKSGRRRNYPTSQLEVRMLGNLAAGGGPLHLSSRGVRSVTVELCPSVHGEGDTGFIPRLIDTAKARGFSAYVEDGGNRWPAVHRLDAARLYRLAVEKAPSGSRFEGAADEGVPFREIADAIGRRLNVPVVGIAREEADAHFGFLGTLASLDIPRSNAAAREVLGWQPVQPGLLADLEQPHYFDLVKR